jgi:DNA-binding CsgD family transcriptional regulator
VTPPSSSDDNDWQQLVAIGLVAGDTSAGGIARFAGVHVAEAEAAIAAAQMVGVLREDGTVDNAMRARAVADLPLERVAEIHAAAARHYFAAGPDRLIDAVDHARAAGALLPLEELVDMADHGGRMALSLGDYATAQQLLALAAEFDAAGSHATRGARLCDLAAATHGLGQVEGARRHLAEAVQLAELAGDGPLAARAAVAYSLPVDWDHGNAKAAGLLQRAENLSLTDQARVEVHAGRAIVEMRIPVNDKAGQQVAWITRPNVAQPLAEAALADSKDAAPEVRLLALLAWRATHSSPAFLAQRREVATEALATAQRLRDPSMQVESAVRLAVDAVESGDRPLFDEALAVARWVSERDGNPRLKWRALTLSVGAAHLDRDMALAEDLLARAREISVPLDLPGSLAAELVFAGQAAIKQDDDLVLGSFLFDDSSPLASSAVARAGAAYAAARLDQPDRAVEHVRRALQLVDMESTYLGVVSVLAETAVQLGSTELVTELADLLTPWAEHVAVDSNAWWCVGPVALRLAELHQHLGDQAEARRYLDLATPVATALNDAHSIDRCGDLAARLQPRVTAAEAEGLTPRELDVLRLIAAGATNPQIATELAYSLSTIRTDTVSIYKKLGVGGRTEAVSYAVREGLVDVTR